MGSEPRSQECGALGALWEELVQWEELVLRGGQASPTSRPGHLRPPASSVKPGAACEADQLTPPRAPLASRLVTMTTMKQFF